MHARLKHFLCTLLSVAVFASGIPMREAMAMNVTGAGSSTRGSLYDQDYVDQVTAEEVSTNSRMPASLAKPKSHSSSSAAAGGVEVIRAACRNPRMVRYTNKVRGPDGQNVYFRYIVADNEQTFECVGVGIGPVKTKPKTEGGVCEGCETLQGGPAQNLEEIANQVAQIAPVCPTRSSPTALQSMFAGQTCMVNAVKGVIAAIADLIKGIGYLVGAAVSWVKGKFFGAPKVQQTDNAMTKVMNFFRTMSRAKLYAIMKDTGAWLRMMSKAFVQSIYDSAKDSAGCMKWSGIPLASKCEYKGPGWDCMNWNQKLQTMCSLVGAVGSDIALLFVGGIGVGKLVAKSARLMQVVNAAKAVASTAVKAASRAVAAGGRGAQMAIRAADVSARIAAAPAVFSGKTVIRAISLVDKLPGFKQYAHASEKAFLAGFKIGNRTTAGTVRAIETTSRVGQAARAADDLAGAGQNLTSAEIRAMTPPPPPNARPIESTSQVEVRLRTNRDFKSERTTASKFDARNNNRQVIPESEQGRFRAQVGDPQPGGRTVVIKDNSQASNVANLGAVRANAITTSLVERSALKFDQFAQKYKSEINVTRIQTKNGIEVRVDPVRGTRLPESIETDLADVYKATVVEHTNFLKQNKLVRPTDDPAQFFKYGSGPDSQTANLTATGSRKLKGTLETNRWEDAVAQAQLESVFHRAQQLNSNLRQNYRSTPLFTAEGRITPHIADIISKSRSPEELIEKLKPYKFLEADKSGRPLSQAEKLARAEELKEFISHADNFGTSYYGARTSASIFEDACTGASLEVCRQIGRNLSHNATIFDGEYGDVVTSSIRAERAASDEFNAIIDSSAGSRRDLHQDDISTVLRNQDGTPVQELPPEVLDSLAQCKGSTSCLKSSYIPERVKTQIDGKTIELERPQVIAITRELEDRLKQRISSLTNEMKDTNFKIRVSATGRMTLDIPTSPLATRAETITAYDRLLKSRREFQNLVENYPDKQALRGLAAESPDLPLLARPSIPDGQDAFRFTTDRQVFDSQLTLPRNDGSQAWMRSIELYPDADQKIRGMAYLLKQNGIEIVQGERRFANGTRTSILGRDEKYLFIPDGALASDAAMIKFLEESTTHLRLDPSKLPADAAKLLENAYEKQGLVPYEIADDEAALALSHSNNVIGIKQSTGENAGGAVIHELSHNTATKRLEDLKNSAPRNATPEQLSAWEKKIEKERLHLTGRLIQFEATDAFAELPGYGKYFRADEVESRWSQIAYDELKGMDSSHLALQMDNFLEAQGNRILRLKIAPDSDWKLTRSNYGYTSVSVDGLDFNMQVKYISGANQAEQIAFIRKVIDDRFDKLLTFKKKLIERNRVGGEMPPSAGRQSAFLDVAAEIKGFEIVLPRKGAALEVRAEKLLVKVDADPKFLGLLHLIEKNGMGLYRGQARFRNKTSLVLEGKIGKRIFVPEAALKDDETLLKFLEAQTKELRIKPGTFADDAVTTTLPNGSERRLISTDELLSNSYERQGVVARLTSDEKIDGASWGSDLIDLNPDAYRPGSTVIHELTHNTSEGKLRRLLIKDPPDGMTNQELARWFKGYRRNLKDYTARNIVFEGGASELSETYRARYRADEVEARIKEIAFRKSRNLDFSYVADTTRTFITTQKNQIQTFLETKPGKWKIEQRSKHGVRIKLTTSDVQIDIPYVEGTSLDDQKRFITELLNERIDRLKTFESRIDKVSPSLERTAQTRVASKSGRSVFGRQAAEAEPRPKSDSNLIGFAAEDAPPMVMPDRANRPARPIQTVREAAAEIRRRPGYNVRRMGVKRFVENNRARPIISKAEQKRFREVMENPHPEGRTVVIRDFDKKKNNTTYGLDRSTAITTTLVERAAIRYQKIATKYADDVTMVRFEGPNRLEVRFEPKPGKHLPATLEAELADVFKFSVVEHADFLHQNQLVRATDNPTETFKYGSGPDSHAANLTARSNREFDNQLATYRWEDPATQTQMQTVFAHAKSLHKKIKEQYKGTDLIVKETGRIDPTLADIIAKSDTPEAIIENLREYNVLSRDNKGRFLSREEQLARARELDEYVESARNLGIEYYGERTPLNLKTDDTVCFGSDLCGQNGRNLSHNTSILDGEFDDVVAASVRAEKASTDEFNVLIDNTIAARKRTFEEQGFKVRSMRSGDDISMTIENPDGTPVVELDEKALREVGSCTDGVACLRDTYVPAKVETMIKGRRAVRDKQVIIDKTHDLEKALKKTLPKRYKKHNFHIAVDKDGVMTLIMSSPKQMTESQFLQHAADEEMARRAFADMVNAMKPDDTLGLRARAVESTLSPPTTSLPVKNEASQYARTSDSTLRDIQSRQNLDSSKIPPLSATETAEASTASGLSTRWTQIKERFLAGSERNKIEKLLSQHVISDLHSGDPKARARAIKTNDALASAIRNRLKSLGIQSELSRAPVDIEHLQKLEAAYSSAISQAKQIVTEQKYTGSDKKTALTMIKVAEEKLRGVRLDLAQGTNGPYTRIVINGANSKFLDGVKNKLGIDELVFDLESKQRFSTSGASFNGTERRLQIPIETLLDSNKDNLLSDVFLHEISHAAIERKRQAGVRTPYYIKARSIGELPITEMDGYDMFFSIDEINSYRKQIANILRGRTLGKSVTSFGSFKMSMSDYLGSAGIQYRSSLRAGQSISKEARKVLADSKYHKDILIFKESKTPEVHIPIFRDNAIAGYIEITVTDVLPTDSVEEIIRKTNVYLDEVDKMIKRDVESFKK